MIFGHVLKKHISMNPVISGLLLLGVVICVYCISIMPFFEMLFRYADISSIFIPFFSSISIVRDASVLQVSEKEMIPRYL